MKLDDLFEEKDIRYLADAMFGYSKINPEEFDRWELSSSVYYIKKSEVLTNCVGFPIVDRIFALRHRKNHKLEFQEVQRRIEGFSTILVRNMYLASNSGYHVVWEKTKPSYYYWSEYDRDVWIEHNFKYFNVGYDLDVTNFEEIVKQRPDLKYLGYKQGGNLSYLATVYKTYPELEILLKLNYTNMINVSCLEFIRKNKGFVKFMAKQKHKYSFPVLKKAYTTHLDCEKIEKENRIARAIPNRRYAPYKQYATKEKICSYTYEKKCGVDTYFDLLDAVSYLKLDLNDTKNIFPYDFQKMHRLYTSQMNIAIEKEKAEELKKVAFKYSPLETTINNLVFYIPKTLQEFVDEGEKMDNCVGRMGYSEKMSNNEDLIVFVRDTNGESLATLEVGIKQMNIRQLYAPHNSKCPDNIRNIVVNNWMPKARKLITKLKEEGALA